MQINPLNPKQEAFLLTKIKYSALIGGVGSGKTFAGAMRALMRCEPGKTGMIVAPTYQMMRDPTQATFFKMLDNANIKYTYHSANDEQWADVRGCKVLFRSSDSPKRLRGPNLDWGWLDEAGMMVEEAWKVMLGRIRKYGATAWITTTPCGFNWIWEYWVNRQNKKYQIWQVSSRENKTLDPAFVEDLAENYTGEYAKQEIDGEFVAFEGLVYSEFSHLLHIVDPFPIPDGWTRCRGIDYGYTNPFVCLWGAIDPDGRLYIYDEHYRRKTLIADHAKAIKLRAGQWQFTVADHDAQDNAEMQSAGVSTRNAQKDVIRGIQKVKARLEKAGDGKPRLFIMRNCVNTIREMGMYRWQEAKGQRNEKEEPMKECDHACDCLRYMTFELDNKRVYVYAV